MRRSSPCKFRRDGFTLVELLVVIGIVAAVVALLLPILARAKSYAVRVQCANNMRQLYNACLLFANERKGLLPRPCGWNEHGTTLPEETLCWGSDGPAVVSLERGVLGRYLPAAARQEPVLCPADNSEPAWLGTFLPAASRNFSYSFNSNICIFLSSGERASIRLQSVIRPAEKVMIYEELAPNDAWCLNPDFLTADYPSGRHGVRGALNTRRDLYDPLYLKQGLGNHAFFDGHVETTRPMQIIGHTELYRPLTAATW